MFYLKNKRKSNRKLIIGNRKPVRLRFVTQFAIKPQRLLTRRFAPNFPQILPATDYGKTLTVVSDFKESLQAQYVL
jgi:hypothetical protein